MNNFEGIIIKTINYSDSSKILYLLTPSGMESLLAKGAKKTKSPIRHLTQTITKISYNKSRSASLPTLLSGDIVDDFNEIKLDLESQTYTTHIFELIYRMSTEIDFQKLYEFTSKILTNITETKDPEFMSFVFELKYLYLLGLAPVFKACVECGNQERVGFDVIKGGMVCNEHLSRHSISESTVILALYKLYFYQFDGIFDIDRRQVRLALDSYYEHHLTFKSKSREILYNLLGY
jgi:DNA repair protein RecO (recombination protein O)